MRSLLGSSQTGTCQKEVISFQPPASLNASHRMWNVDGVEDSLRIGEEGGAGFHVWVTLGRKGSRSCLFTLQNGSRRGD